MIKEAWLKLGCPPVQCSLNLPAIESHELVSSRAKKKYKRFDARLTQMITRVKGRLDPFMPSTLPFINRFGTNMPHFGRGKLNN